MAELAATIGISPILGWIIYVVVIILVSVITTKICLKLRGL